MVLMEMGCLFIVGRPSCCTVLTIFYRMLGIDSYKSSRRDPPFEDLRFIRLRLSLDIVYY